MCKVFGHKELDADMILTAHDFLASRSSKTRQNHMVVQCLVLGEFVLSLLSTQHKGFSLGPSHLIITCYGSGRSCWRSHRMRSHCLKILYDDFTATLNCAAVSSSLWNNDFTNGITVQYRSSPNLFNISKKAFLKNVVRISNMWAVVFMFSEYW